MEKYTKIEILNCINNILYFVIDLHPITKMVAITRSTKRFLRSSTLTLGKRGGKLKKPCATLGKRGGKRGGKLEKPPGSPHGSPHGSPPVLPPPVTPLWSPLGTPPGTPVNLMHGTPTQIPAMINNDVPQPNHHIGHINPLILPPQTPHGNPYLTPYPTAVVVVYQHFYKPLPYQPHGGGVDGVGGVAPIKLFQ